MESKTKMAGHPIHPMLIVFPLGLLSTAIVFDIVGLIASTGTWFDISYWMMVAGLVGGVLASAFGLLDWFAIPYGTRAKQIGLWHGLGNGMVVFLFLISAVLRTGVPGRPSTAALMFSFLGLLLAVVSAWLGGELVNRLGVGVDEGAHLNAPSSLSGRPANEDQRRQRSVI